MVEGGMKCIKYLLFAFNLIFFIVGLALIALGIVIQVLFKPYVDFFDNSALSAPAILVIVVGVVILLLGFFGCCGAVKENYCMVMTFAVLMFLIFILELAAGIAGFVMKDSIETFVKQRLNDTMPDYLKGNGSVAMKGWDEIQTHFKCCGVNGKGDWSPYFTGDAKYPDSCCNSTSTVIVKGCAATKPAYTAGCVDKVEGFLVDNIWKIGGVGIGFAVIQIIGIIFACCLGRSIKGGYEVA